MSIPSISVNRPIFISCLVLLVFFVGYMNLRSLPVSLFPTTEVPFIIVTTTYPGAGPKEVELSISKYLEDELTTVEGVKKITTKSRDSVSTAIIEFKTGLNLDVLEQRVRESVALAKNKFPKNVEASIIERLNPSNQSVITAFIPGDRINPVQLTSWIEQQLKPNLLRVPQVGRIEIFGAQKRQIDIVANSEKLEKYGISFSQIMNQMQGEGKNIPGGSIQNDSQEISLRSVGQYSDLKSIGDKIISFGNGETSIRIKDVANVIDTSKKVTSKGYYNSKSGILIDIYRQSGSNAIAVTDRLKQKIKNINKENEKSNLPTIEVVHDGSTMIRDNVEDVWESIAFGVGLTIVVVYLFLGTFKSTLITGFAIPHSLLGAFILMGVSGFSINILTLLALSLSVGLLVDDAIVVRENIFKHIESGMKPKEAAVFGANEVGLAILGVTLAVISMFGPVAFLKGVVGQFFQEFGLVICYATVVSLFDAMTVAPMLSAYWGSKTVSHSHKVRSGWRILLNAYEIVHEIIEKVYAYILRMTIKVPSLTVIVIFAVSFYLISYITKLPSSFLPTDESKEFTVSIGMPVGTSLEYTNYVANWVDKEVKKNPYIDSTILIVGNDYNEIYSANIFVFLKDKKERGRIKPSEIRESVRKQISYFQGLPKCSEILVRQIDISGSGVRPFALVVQAKDFDKLQNIVNDVFNKLSNLKTLVSPDLSLKPGGKEIQIKLIDSEASRLGLTAGMIGKEIRARVEGVEVAKYNESGFEYNIVLKSNDTSKTWLQKNSKILVPNINNTLIDLKKAATFTLLQSPSIIQRLERRYAGRITADLIPGGDLSAVILQTNKIMNEIIKNNPDVSYVFEGDVENYNEMAGSMKTAMIFGVVLLFLVLASLYESFLLSFLNIVTLPLAISGAFFSLFITREGLNIYSVIGILMLLGVATKNSILLIDTANRLINSAEEVSTHLIEDAAIRRLRPILMTTMALIAGCLPIAIGMNEASSQRVGMGVAIIGGAITSTVFSLLLVPSMLELVNKSKSLIRGLKNYP